MNSRVVIPLNSSPEQLQRLLALQAAFAEVCNALAPVVQTTRTWNRVALHHMAYRTLRERFPAVGSQMVCNAIYSVSRHCRALFQAESSPFNIARIGNRPLPLLRFLDNCPVFFDRHTLSIKGGQLSMFTLDGRMRFHLDLRMEDEASFHQKKLRELVLSRSPHQSFVLTFTFAEDGGVGDAKNEVIVEEDTSIHQYLKIEESHANT